MEGDFEGHATSNGTYLNAAAAPLQSDKTAAPDLSVLGKEHGQLSLGEKVERLLSVFEVGLVHF